MQKNTFPSQIKRSSKAAIWVTRLSAESLLGGLIVRIGARPAAHKHPGPGRHSSLNIFIARSGLEVFDTDTPQSECYTPVSTIFNSMQN